MEVHAFPYTTAAWQQALPHEEGLHSRKLDFQKTIATETEICLQNNFLPFIAIMTS